MSPLVPYVFKKGITTMGIAFVLLLVWPLRSWWLPLSDPDALREGANMLSIVLHPAAEQALRAKAAYPYPVPTMQVSRLIGEVTMCGVFITNIYCW